MCKIILNILKHNRFFFQINTKDRVEKCVNFIKSKFMYNPIYLFFYLFILWMNCLINFINKYIDIGRSEFLSIVLLYNNSIDLIMLIQN